MNKLLFILLILISGCKTVQKINEIDSIQNKVDSIQTEVDSIQIEVDSIQNKIINKDKIYIYGGKVLIR